jgi:hypothetical protein
LVGDHEKKKFDYSRTGLGHGSCCSDDGAKLDDRALVANTLLAFGTVLTSDNHIE